jgi:starvation-inducible DNA-binding protein
MKTKTRDTLYETRLSLDANVCQAICDRMGVLLASLQDFRSQVQFAHWNLKGPNFIGLHKHFDDLADTINELIDETAERIVTLGGTAFGTLRQSLDRSILDDLSADGETSTFFIPALADRCAALANECRSAVRIAEDAGDPASTDLVTQMGRTLEKQLYLLTSHEA